LLRDLLDSATDRPSKLFLRQLRTLGIGRTAIITVALPKHPAPLRKAVPRVLLIHHLAPGASLTSPPIMGFEDTDLTITNLPFLGIRSSIAESETIIVTGKKMASGTTAGRR
jgi:hypothetical protein